MNRKSLWHRLSHGWICSKCGADAEINYICTGMELIDCDVCGTKGQFPCNCEGPTVLRLFLWGAAEIFGWLWSMALGLAGIGLVVGVFVGLPCLAIFWGYPDPEGVTGHHPILGVAALLVWFVITSICVAENRG